MGISRKRTREFVSLHSHTTYSYGDGYGPVADHVKRIEELGGSALALTEHGNAGSWVQLEKATRNTDVKPIFGLEAYAAPPGTRQKFHQTVLAENQQGLQNLNEMVSRSYSEGFYQWPTVHGNMMQDHAPGLIMTSGCADSLLSCTLLGGKSLGERRDRASRWDMDNAERIVRRYQSMLGEDGFYLEVQRFPGLDRTRTLNPAFAELSRRTGAPLVATADVHYPHGRENELQKILHAAHRGGTVDSVEAAWEYDILLTYPESDWQIYQDMIGTGLEPYDAWRAIKNTQEIAKRCNVVLPKNEPLRFPMPNGTTPEEMLWERLREGWRFRWAENKRLRADPDGYAKKLNYEMDLVVAKGYCDYFLTTAYLVVRAKDKGIPVGPARGSAAASLALYLLRVTEVDPMQFPTMVFERFIDHGRTDLPDIDLDFADDRRDEVRADAAAVFGADRVANIANVVGYKGKNSINDVAKVYRIPKHDTETIKDVILERSGGDSRADNTLEDSIAMFPQAQAAYERHPEFKWAMELEGNVRGMSVHAAGLVISNAPINDTCALMTRKVKGENRTVLPYDKKDAEYLGMLKMDFLGLSTMGMIRLCLDMIPGMELVDLYRVPLDNKRVLRAFRDNWLQGIFQYEGRATKLVNAGVSPDHFMHLADINALSRPGPLFSGMTAEYMKVKKGEHEADQIHPMVWKHTQHTYGQIIYQEQVLEIIREIGGFPVAKIGDIRRIISQKLGEASMQTMFEEFVAGAAKHDIDRALATRIWKFMVTSATYSFNIAHCISYAMLAFWCMYLKVYYPREFYAAQLQKIGDDKKAREYRRPKLLNDAIKAGFKIYPPDPQRSHATWRRHPRDKKGILAGFSQMDGVGAITAQHMNEYRQNFSPVEWGDYTAVKGIGAKTIVKIQEFAESDDPFDVELTARTLDEIRTGIKRRHAGYRGLPVPTHRSDEIPRNVSATGGLPVTFMGIVRKIEYKDVIEDERARTGDDLETILKRLKNPELTKSVTLHCYDDGDDDVYVRFNRWAFPKYREQIEQIAPGEDVIIVSGEKSPGFGVSLNRVKSIVRLAAEGEDEEEEIDVA